MSVIFYIIDMIENYKWPSLQLFLIRWQALGTWLAYSNACLEIVSPTAQGGSFGIQVYETYRTGVLVFQIQSTSRLWNPEWTIVLEFSSSVFVFLWENCAAIG